MVVLTASVPEGAVRRLSEHYGRQVDGWLSQVGGTVHAAARRWGVQLAGFHDAGWTSVVGVGCDRSMRQVLLKAMPDAHRYHRERAALSHWAGHGVCRLLDADDHDQVLMVELVGSVPGGATRPRDHDKRVAAAIPCLHRVAVEPDGNVPLLTDYHLGTVVSRVRQRASRFGHLVGQECVESAISLCHDLCADSRDLTMLHSDLYAENVLFDQAQDVVFIDPHAKIGSRAFDWAFWCVYYVPTCGFKDRIVLCNEYVPALVNEVLAWSATLAVDGALYYLDAGEDTVTAMLEILRLPILNGVLGRR